MDAFCIGNELEGTTGRERDWENVIAAVRRVYAEPLTYEAMVTEGDKIHFLDALDFIGISPYYPLVNGSSPTLRSCRLGPIPKHLAQLSERWHRKIVFTELGYRAQTTGLGTPAAFR